MGLLCERDNGVSNFHYPDSAIVPDRGDWRNRVRCTPDVGNGDARHYVPIMPVIVVGADTPKGRAVIEGLVEPGREVRAFVSDPDAGAELRELGVKVALGDVSDDSHVQGACTNCFTAVLMTEAAFDGRERSFATSESQVL